MGTDNRDGGADAVQETTARAFVVGPVLPNDDASRTPEARLEEAVGLAKAIRLEVPHAEVVRVNRPAPATLFGRGTVERLGGIVEAFDIDLVVIDHALTPIQQRNLERALIAKVIDRTALILEIFGARAHTREGQLQVELAALTYQRSRLVRSWTHLERQRGGFGFLGGPGETQLEIDRRLISERIARLKRELEEVQAADLIQHVRDASHPDSEAQSADVAAVLAELGIDADRDARVIEVLNKLDRLDPTRRAALLMRAALADGRAVAVSARTGLGMEDLLTLLDQRLDGGRRVVELDVDLTDGRTLAWLYEHGQILRRDDGDGVAHMRVALDPADATRLTAGAMR